MSEEKKKKEKNTNQKSSEFGGKEVWDYAGVKKILESPWTISGSPSSSGD